jgi:Fur family ferric uptake transcriptional regulator
MERTSLGQRQTRQREEIVQVIRSAPGPLTVPQILERAQQSIPALGVATVYRTLKLLQDAGQVKSVILPSGDTRWEMAGLGHHHHFHCRACQQVYHVEGCPLSLPRDRRVGGFVVDGHDLTFHGTCPSCEK